MAINYRSHFAYRIDAWDADGESVIEHLAGVEDLQVAKATYLAACQRWPGTPITLRQGTRKSRYGDGEMQESTARNSDRSAKQHACGRIELSALAEICVTVAAAKPRLPATGSRGCWRGRGARCSTAETPCASDYMLADR
jgi:hypothetical protein